MVKPEIAKMQTSKQRAGQCRSSLHTAVLTIRVNPQLYVSYSNNHTAPKVVHESSTRVLCDEQPRVLPLRGPFEVSRTLSNGRVRKMPSGFKINVRLLK
jgi:hypothetical protein